MSENEAQVKFSVKDDATRAMKEIGSSLKGLRKVFKDFESSYRDVQKVTKSAENAHKSYKKSISDVEAYRKLQDESANLLTTLSNLKKKQEDFISAFGKPNVKLEKNIKSTISEFIKLSNTMNSTYKSFSKLDWYVYKSSVAIDKYGKTSMRVAKESFITSKINKLIKEHIALQREIKRTDEVYKKVFFKKKLEEIDKSIEKYSKSLNKLRSTEIRLNRDVEQSVKGMISFASSVKNTISAMRNFDKIQSIENIKKQIEELEFKQKLAYANASKIPNIKRNQPSISEAFNFAGDISKEINKLKLDLADLNDVVPDIEFAKNVQNEVNKAKVQLDIFKEKTRAVISFIDYSIKTITFKDIQKKLSILSKKGFDKTKKSVKKLRKDLSLLKERGWRANAKSAGLFSKRVAIATKKVVTHRKVLIPLKNTIKFVSTGYLTAARSAKTAAKAMSTVIGTGMARGLSLIGQKILGIDEGFGRLARGGIGKLGQAISDIVRGTITKGLSAFKQLAVDSVTTFSSFEMTMKKIKQFGGFAGSEMSSVEALMKNTMKTTLFTAEELGVAFEELAAVGEFGGNVEGFNEVAQAMVSMATATGETDLERTGQILMSTLNAFRTQLDAAGMDANDVGDILVKVANESALSVSQIGTAMQYVNQSAAAAGISLSDTAAAVGFLSNMGFEASRAGTALNQAMKSMIDPSKEAQTIMDNMNLSFFDSATGEMKSMVEIAEMMNQRFEELGLTTEQQLDVMADLFGVRGSRAVQAMMNETEQLKAMMESMGDSSGAMQRGMEEMMNTVQGKTAMLQGTFETIKISIAEAFDGTLRQALTVLNDFLNTDVAQNFFTDLSQSIVEVANILFPFVESVLPSLMTILQSTMPLVQSIATLFTNLFAPFANVEFVQQFASSMLGLAKAVNVLIGPFIKIIAIVMANLMPIFEFMVNMISNSLGPVFSEIFNMFNENMPLIMDMFKKFAQILGVLVPVIAVIFKAFVPLIGILLRVFIPIMDQLLNIIIALLPAFMAVAQAVMFVSSVLQLLEPILQVVSWLIVHLILKPFEYVAKFISAIFTVIMVVIKGIVSGLLSIAEAGAELGIPGADKVRDALKGIDDDLKDASKSTIAFGDDLNQINSSPKIDFEVDKSSWENISNDTGIPYNPDESMDIKTNFVDLNQEDIPMDQGELSLNVNTEEIYSELQSNFEELGSSIGDILSDKAMLELSSNIDNVPSINETNNSTVNNSNVTVNNEIHISASDVSNVDTEELSQNIAEEIAGRLP